MIIRLKQLELYQPIKVDKETRCTHQNDFFIIEWFVPDFFVITSRKNPSAIQCAPMANAKGWHPENLADLPVLRSHYGVDSSLEADRAAAIAMLCKGPSRTPETESAVLPQPRQQPIPAAPAAPAPVEPPNRNPNPPPARSRTRRAEHEEMRIEPQPQPLAQSEIKERARPPAKELLQPRQQPAPLFPDDNIDDELDEELEASEAPAEGSDLQDEFDL